MIYKYYTAELVVLKKGAELEAPSITIKTWFFRNPLDAITMMKNQLESWGFKEHRIINLRRIT